MHALNFILFGVLYFEASVLSLGVGDGQGGMVCCSSLGCKELDMTEQLN